MVKVIGVERWQGKAGCVSMRCGDVHISFGMGTDRKIQELSRYRYGISRYYRGATHIQKEDYKYAVRTAYAILLEKRLPVQKEQLQLNLGRR